MNSLKYRMLRTSLFVLVFINCMSSCSNDKCNAKTYSLLNEQLIKSTWFIQRSTVGISRRLEYKMTDPLTAQKATIWNEKVNKLRKQAANVFDYIENLKNRLKKEKTITQQDELYDKLTLLKQYSLDIDSNLNSGFKKEINFLTTEYDSIPEGKKNFKSTYFSDSSSEAIMCILSKFQNKVAIIENLLTEYCNEQIGSGSWHRPV